MVLVMREGGVGRVVLVHACTRESLVSSQQNIVEKVNVKYRQTWIVAT